jgi:hypothetical protein
VKVVHIAGMGTRIGSRVRQLCAWCGYRLIDEDLALMASPDGPPDVKAWETNAWVEVEEEPGFRGCTLISPPAAGGLPVGNCVDEPAPRRNGPRLATVSGDGCADPACDPSHAHGRFLPGNAPGVCLAEGCPCVELVRAR